MAVGVDDSTYDNTATNTAPAVFVQNLSFRYRAFDDDPDDSSKNSSSTEQVLVIKDISVQLAKRRIVADCRPKWMWQKYIAQVSEWPDSQ